MRRVSQAILDTRREMAALAADQIDLNLRVGRARADLVVWCGYSESDSSSWRRVRVDPDGTVRAWDTVGHMYSQVHDLTPAEIAEAQRLAGLVRAGTHYLASGYVYARAEVDRA